MLDFAKCLFCTNWNGATSPSFVHVADMELHVYLWGSSIEKFKQAKVHTFPTPIQNTTAGCS